MRKNMDVVVIKDTMHVLAAELGNDLSQGGHSLDELVVDGFSIIDPSSGDEMGYIEKVYLDVINVEGDDSAINAPMSRMVEEAKLQYLMPKAEVNIDESQRIEIKTPEDVTRRTAFFIQLTSDTQTINIHPDALPTGTRRKTLAVPELVAGEYKLIAFVSGFVPIIETRSVPV